MKLNETIINAYYSATARPATTYTYTSGDYLKSLQIAERLKKSGHDLTDGTISFVSNGRAVQTMPKLIENRIFPHVAKMHSKPTKNEITLWAQCVGCSMLTIRDHETKTTTEKNARERAQELIRKISKFSAAIEGLVFFRAIELKPVRAGKAQRFSLHAHLIVASKHQAAIEAAAGKTFAHVHNSKRMRNPAAVGAYVHKAQINDPEKFTGRQLSAYIKITEKLRTHQALGLFADFRKELKAKALKISPIIGGGLAIIPKAAKSKTRKKKGEKPTKNKVLKLTRSGLLVENFDMKTAPAIFNIISGVSVPPVNCSTVQTQIKKAASKLIKKPAVLDHPQLFKRRGRPPKPKKRKKRRHAVKVAPQPQPQLIPEQETPSLLDLIDN